MDTPFALHRFQHYGTCFIAGLRDKGGQVIENGITEPLQKRLKTGLIFALSGSGQRSHCPAVKRLVSSYYFITLFS